MTPAEVMISESQERMLYVTDRANLPELQSILEMYEIRHSILGVVREHQDLVVRQKGEVVAQMPSQLVAHAPPADRSAKRPKYLDRLKSIRQPRAPANISKVLLSLLSNPTIAGKRWVYQQYDHEVGIRTVIKPGSGDAAVLRLHNNKFLSLKLDGNSKHCYLDPYQGTLGCLSEGRRNVICTGAEPIGVVDHLQFANPKDPEIFWTFTQAVAAVVDYCKFMEIPVVGGKVSFYNETAKGPIKPSPVIGSLGLVEDHSHITRPALNDGNSIFIVGYTNDEMGGSEYYEYYHGVTGGPVPKVDLQVDRQNGRAILRLIKNGLVDCAHDCSKGGLAVALAEMAVAGSVGFSIDQSAVPNSCRHADGVMFSESHSRYIIGTKEPDMVCRMLSTEGVVFAELGKAAGKNIEFFRDKKLIAKADLKQLEASYESLEKLMQQ
jgi:phosphoribosylformylglycinamidine synthase